MFVHVYRTILIIKLRPPTTSITTGRKGGKVLFVDGYVFGTGGEGKIYSYIKGTVARDFQIFFTNKPQLGL
jgi:hypothetical protein